MGKRSIAGWVSTQQLFDMFCRFSMQAGHGACKLAPKIFINQMRLHSPTGWFTKISKRLCGGVGGVAEVELEAEAEGWKMNATDRKVRKEVM